jgi:hypothetical protein
VSLQTCFLLVSWQTHIAVLEDMVCSGIQELPKKHKSGPLFPSKKRDLTHRSGGSKSNV